MIFKQLKLAAFGPFENVLDIDFTDLNKEGIFLITGPTGVGKTSIFDAICFALYGEISGSNGIIDKVRSDYADNTTLTYVELTFMVENQEFFIRREPPQMKIGKHNCLVNHPHSAYIKYGDQNINGALNVSRKVQEIIGLNADLFRQIVMIPQGEFMKLLTASSEEKGEIFRHIFNTKMILDFQQKLIETAKEKEENIKNDRLRLKTKLQDLDISELFLEKLNNEYLNYDEIFLMIENKISLLGQDILMIKNAKEESLNSCNNLLERINYIKKHNALLLEYEEKIKEKEVLMSEATAIDDIRRLNGLYYKALALKELEDKIADLTEQLRENKLSNEEINVKIRSLNEQIFDLDNQLTKLIEQKPLIDELRSQKPNLEFELSKCSKKKELEDEIEEIKKEVIIALKNFDVLQADLNQISLSKRDVVQEIENLSANNQDITKLYQEKNRLLAEEKTISGLSTRFEKRVTLLQEITTTDEKIRAINKDTLELLSLKAHYERQTKINIASQLSKNLKENAPCPVCGSTHHPKLAVFDATNDDNKLDEIKSKQIKNEIDLDNAIKRIGEIKKECLIISEALEDDEDVRRLGACYENIFEMLNGVKTDIDLIDKTIEKTLAINEKIRSWQDKKMLIEEKEQMALTALEEGRKTLDLKNGMIEKCISKLEIYDNASDEESILQIISANDEQISSYEKDYQNLLQQKESYAKESFLLATNLTSVVNEQLKLEPLIKEAKEEKGRQMALFQDDEYLHAMVSEEDFLANQALVEEFDRKQFLLNSKLEELSRLTDNYLYQNEEEFQSTYDTEKKKYEGITENLVLKNSALDSLMSKLTEIKDSYQQCSNKLSDYELYYRLARIANGTNNLKMPFEKYILSAYFIDILDYANLLLSRMTKNRFQLVKRDFLAKGNAKQGLDLEVCDYNTGKLRDIKTLSGGESFKAALCLALGLSEVIRRRSSLVSINTLFIDEGFGSLDPESLDMALGLLLEMRDSDRVIGIISHVGELKNKIHSQIVLGQGKMEIHK